MRTLFFIVVNLLYVSSSFSQTFFSNYLDQTSEWRKFTAGFNGFHVFETYETSYFDGIETINGLVYYKEYRKTKTNYGFPVLYSEDFLNGPFYIREAIDGKIWRYNIQNNIENLYYDNQVILNAQVGEAFPSESASAGCLVESVESVTLGTSTLKKISGSNNFTVSGMLEGVGYLGIPCGSMFEGVSYLNCYTKQNNTLQLGTIDCGLFPTPSRQGLSENDYTIQQKITISPVPASDVLHIKNNLDIQIESVFVYNSLGQLILDSKESTTNINIAGFKKGTYILMVKYEKGVFINKFIKE